MEGSRVDTNIQKVLTRLSNAHHLIGGEYLLFDPKNNTFYTNESKFYLVDNKWHVKTCDVNELSTTLDALSLQKKNKGPGRPNLTVNPDFIFLPAQFVQLIDELIYL